MAFAKINAIGNTYVTFQSRAKPGNMAGTAAIIVAFLYENIDTIGQTLGIISSFFSGPDCLPGAILLHLIHI